jgi:hypothetical protein
MTGLSPTVSCLLVALLAPAAPPAAAPAELVPPPAAEAPPAIEAAPASEAPPVTETPQVAEAPPAAAPEAPEAPEAVVWPEPVRPDDPAHADPPSPTPPPPPDRVELRNGGVVDGSLVEVVPRSHVTILVQGTRQSRTFNWAEIEYVRRAGEPRQAASAGKPTIAELARASDRIERKQNIGLGLAYAGYVGTVFSAAAWIGVAFEFDARERVPLLVTASGLTAVTVGLLAGGGALFFKARREREDLRAVILSAAPTPGGATVGVSGRF